VFLLPQLAHQLKELRNLLHERGISQELLIAEGAQLRIGQGREARGG
jgi:hypothetical protein